MQPFIRVNGVAVPLDDANIDTNQLCPTRFNKVPRGPRYADVLFHDQRFDASGARREFVLNRAPYDKSQVIVSNINFGCGSSRETAVYALYEFGIRCVIAPSFGDIFAANCAKNGLLALTLSESECADIRRALHADIGARVAVDLEAQTVAAPDGKTYAFDIHPVRKRCLLKGLDDISRTLEFRSRIDAFEATYKAALPWRYGATGRRR